MEAEHLDRLDHRILAELASDARLSMQALADRVGLSKSPVLVRVRRLERDGYIRGYRADVDPEKLGRSQVAFVQVTLGATTSEALDAFNAAVRQEPLIESCHMIAGSFDYLVKVRSESVAAFRRVLGETISRLPNVAQTSSFLSIESVKDS